MSDDEKPQQINVTVNNNGGCCKTGCLVGLLVLIVSVVAVLLLVGSCATFLAEQHGKTKAGSAGAPSNGDDRKAR